MDFAFIANPYHRGGITRWIVDFASAWHTSEGTAHVVVPRPRAPFVSAGGRPTVAELLDAIPLERRPMLVTPPVGAEFEFGSVAYRAAVYAESVMSSVPAGVPLMTTDDPAAWRAASWLSGRHPVVAVLHGDADIYYDLLAEHERGVAAVVGVSARIAAKAAKRLRRPEVECSAIACGVDVPEIAPARAPGPLRLLWVGRVEEYQKRVSDLPKIVKALRGRLPFFLTIVGDGPDRAATEQGMRDAVAAGEVAFVGWLSADAVRSEMERADVVLLPSNFEGMPVALMEAMGQGCAAVASRVSGIEDYADDPRAAQCLAVHEVGDVPGAVDGILSLAAVPASVRVARAHSLALTEFSLPVCVNRYRELLADVVPPAAPGAPRTRLERVAISAISYPLAASRLLRLRLRRPWRAPAAPTA